MTTKQAHPVTYERCMNHSVWSIGNGFSVGPCQREKGHEGECSKDVPAMVTCQMLRRDGKGEVLMTTKRGSAPDVIYLQWVGDDVDNLTPDQLAMQPGPGAVTWCSDKQFDTDVEYVRASAQPRCDEALALMTRKRDLAVKCLEAVQEVFLGHLTIEGLKSRVGALTAEMNALPDAPEGDQGCEQNS